jgi:hypothetical protein
MALVLSTVTSHAQVAHSQDTFELPAFTATQAMGSLPPGKVYHSGSNIRSERVPGLDTIYLAATDKEYHLYQRGYCIEMAAAKSTLVPSPLQLLFGTKVERTAVGTEVVEGHTCEVEKIVATTAEGVTTESKVWEAEDLQGVPVKIVSQTKHGPLMAVFHDITLGAPDAALFQPPNKCIPVEKMSQVAPGQGIRPAPHKPGESTPPPDTPKKPDPKSEN